MSDGKPATGVERIFGHIDPDALKVVRRLLQAGHEAYLVGGCVRDLYLGRSPKDFDVATSATPETIRKLFRNSRVIGRRFKLAHVFFGPKIIETSTFRAPPQQDDEDDPLITHDNEWGSVEDDARRRDFTINGLFYDVETRKIVDFVDGMDDLDRRVVRTIGEPELRFREDPVRMIRAIKFAARLDFRIDDQTWQALLDVAPDIVRSSRARLLEEIYKLLRSGASRRCFELLLEAGMLHRIMPDYTRQFGRAAEGTTILRAGLRPGSADDPVDSDDAPIEAAAEPAPDDESALRNDLPDEDRLAEAGAAFARGVQAYKEARFDEAREHFAEAQRLAPHPDTLFNLGLAQQSSEHHVDAWRSFDELLEGTTDDREREDILAAQAASRPHVAWLRVQTNLEGIVCLDGAPMPRDGRGVPSMLTTPGAHRLDVDREYRPVELDGGERRMMELDFAPRTPPPPPRRALRALAGLSIGGTAAAAGLGLGAALVDDDRARLGMGLGAAVSGTLALTTSIVALAIHRRTRRWKPQPPLQQCPP
ncbi:MAG: polynucleotide adenylyltransferase PcnB [Myxococcales bacterium]|nr:polynucleotide adenylyltransferase PcnB [Myxococcales bacterium]